MRAVSIYATAVVTAAMLAPLMAAYAQNNQLSVPNVTITAPVAPVEPPYMRDPWKAYGRNPYFGQYRVEEDKFSEVVARGGQCRWLIASLWPDRVLFDRWRFLNCRSGRKSESAAN